MVVLIVFRVSETFSRQYQRFCNCHNSTISRQITNSCEDFKDTHTRVRLDHRTHGHVNQTLSITRCNKSIVHITLALSIVVKSSSILDCIAGRELDNDELISRPSVLRDFLECLHVVLKMAITSTEKLEKCQACLVLSNHAHTTSSVSTGAC